MVRVALYLRVSTGGQDTTNQEIALRDICEKRGWEVVAVYEDKGISGSRGRDKRPALDQMLKDATRRRFDILAAWSVDRLGRSLQDLVTLLSDIQKAGVDLFLHQQALDTSTPSGRAMFGMLSVFGEFEKAMIQSRVRAGLDRAVRSGKRLGRPPITPSQIAAIKRALNDGMSIRKTARAVGVSAPTVIKVKRMAMQPSAEGPSHC